MMSNPEDDSSNSTTTPSIATNNTISNSLDKSSAVDISKNIATKNADQDVSKERTGDLNIVDWEGPDDPQNPLNWTNRKKWTNGALLSIMTMITPLASSMFAPGVRDVLKEFHSSSTILASLCVSVYVLGYAVGPLVIAPISEIFGRLLVYHVSNSFFVIFTIACAVSSNLNMLIGFRLLAGIAGSTVITIGGGSIGDMFSAKERGPAMAVWAIGPLLGPVIGPVAGGFLAQAEGWRWVFWVIAIASGAVTLIMFVFMSETYSVRILELKTMKLRKQTGNNLLRSKLNTGLTPDRLFVRSITLPVRLLIFSPICMLFSLYIAMVYGYLYLLFTTMTGVFEEGYGFSGGTAGLSYLGIGVGLFIGLFTFGIVSKATVEKLEATQGELTPEQRLPIMIPGTLFIPAGLFIYGWTAQNHVFWFVPILGTAFVGLGLFTTFMPITTYLVDAFTIYSASALAANTVIRSVLGALLPLAGPAMYSHLGLGWGNSLLAFIALALSPLPVFFWKYGERIRTNPKFQVKL